MKSVSEATKNAFLHWEGHNTLTVSFPELNYSINNTNIDEEAFELTTRIMTDKSVEFVGCFASCMKLKVRNVNQSLKGQEIHVSITNSVTREKVKLFAGIVDSAPAQTNDDYKDIIAYDKLYSLNDVDVTEWYNNHEQTTISALRDELFMMIGITQVENTLVNDNMAVCGVSDAHVGKLSALSLIKAICQINGVFGIINEDGNFEYLYLNTTEPEVDGAFPSFFTFPSANLFPGVGNEVSAQSDEEWNFYNIEYYSKVDFDDYSVKPVDKVTIRDSADAVGVSYGDGENNYIIQGNILAYGSSSLETVAENIYNKISSISFIPFNANNIGLPFLECGDIISYLDADTDRKFIILSRTIKGIHALWDVYSASGDDVQHEYITDLKLKLEDVKRITENTVKESTYTKDEITEKIQETVDQTTFFYVVDQAPTSFEQNKIYFVRK